MKRYTRFLLLFIAIISCSKGEEVAPAPAAGEVYLNYILTLLQQNSVNRKTINWSEFKTATFQKAPQLQTIQQCYQAIEFALNELKDHHSSTSLRMANSPFTQVLMGVAGTQIRLT